MINDEFLQSVEDWLSERGWMEEADAEIDYYEGSLSLICKAVVEVHEESKWN